MTRICESDPNFILKYHKVNACCLEWRRHSSNLVINSRGVQVGPCGLISFVSCCCV
eukprot:COSAG02_NODE_5675_length_4138_cov_3.914088_2_plen_56_part_00